MPKVVGKELISIDTREIPLEHIKFDYDRFPYGTLTFHAHSSVEGIQFYKKDRNIPTGFQTDEGTDERVYFCP